MAEVDYDIAKGQEVRLARMSSREDLWGENCCGKPDVLNVAALGCTARRSASWISS